MKIEILLVLIQLGCAFAKPKTDAMENSLTKDLEDALVGLQVHQQDNTIKVQVTNKGKPTLNGILGKSLSFTPEETQDCPDGSQCWSWKNQAQLEIKESTHRDETITCENFSWEAEDCRTDELSDCYDMTGAHWYGGTQIRRQKWPLEKWNRPSEPYVAGDSLDDEYGGVLERYWLSSYGVAIYMDWEVPLWLSINDKGDNQLCFTAKYKGSPYLNYDNSQVKMNYTVCQGSDVKHVHKYMLDTFLDKPTDIPDEKMFRDPIWSTWAQFKEDVNQTLVMQYAQQIKANNFSNSQLEIDDNWEVSYGKLDFNLQKFPDPAQMVQDLKELGFRTTLWVHPFCNVDSEYFLEVTYRFMFMKAPDSLLPGLVFWWQGIGAITDFTTERSTNWWTDHLRALRDKYGIDSFKFDAGETNWLPPAYEPGGLMRNPSDFTTKFAEMAYSMDRDVRHQEVRVGARTQHLPIFVRMMDKDSRWTDNNGLVTIIPHALMYSVIGYPFILPDMIGGNAYNNQLPDRELFIRWVELNALLPGFQFSIAPWQYDAEVVQISQEMVQLHQSYAQTMIDLARACVETGEPIIRPLWWVAPEDEQALTIDSEFLLGDDILVAPVVEEGATARDVYLPAGVWRDMNTGEEYEGPLDIQAYPAPLNVLPYFERVVQ